MRSRAKQHIFQVLGVLTAAIFSATALAAYMIYHYSPSGLFVAGNALLSPAITDQISYKDLNPQTGTQARFIFNGIEFAYFDKLSKQQRRIPIDPVTYETFYRWVDTTKSLENITEEVRKEFDQPVATLTLTMRTDTGSPSVTKTFQIIQFTDNDYFRVQLKGEGNAEWAYFYKSHLYEDIMRLFTKA